MSNNVFRTGYNKCWKDAWKYIHRTNIDLILSKYSELHPIQYVGMTRAIFVALERFPIYERPHGFKMICKAAKKGPQKFALIMRNKGLAFEAHSILLAFRTTYSMVEITKVHSGLTDSRSDRLVAQAGRLISKHRWDQTVGDTLELIEEDRKNGAKGVRFWIRVVLTLIELILSDWKQQLIRLVAKFAERISFHMEGGFKFRFTIVRGDKKDKGKKGD